MLSEIEENERKKQQKRKLMLSFSADLLIRHQNFAFCLHNLLLLPSSSMEILRESMQSMDEFSSLYKPDTFLFKSKNTAKTEE